jgi:hypothetical protein
MALYVVEQYDGWGQWAAAPLLLPPLVICVAWLAGGAALVWKHEGDPGGRSILAGAALLGGSPALLLLFRAVTS